MKSTFLFSLLALASISRAGETSSIGGKWQVHSSIAGNDNDLVCTFIQKEDALSGSCTTEQSTVEITGKVTGTKVAWSYKSEYNGTALTVKYDGALDSANKKMTGSVDVPEFNAGGDFTAVRSS